MSFKFYKFCQNGVITVLSAVYALFYSLSVSGNMSWWLGLLISVVATLACFIPPLGMFYPLTFSVFILVALIMSYIDASVYFWLILAILILHIVRYVAMFTFCRSNPEKSLEYDTAIRYGYDYK